MNWKGFSSSFQKGFFNNKTHFNFLNSKLNQNMSRIAFSNKLHFTRVLTLSNSYTLNSLLNLYQMNSSISGSSLESTDLEANKIKPELMENLNNIVELYLKESSKWMCTRLLDLPINLA
jgi:hypothetical protein